MARTLSLAWHWQRAFHLLVIGYEEPKLRARFGRKYLAYRHTVSLWIPRPPLSGP